ncbi:hypothetical protein [Bifidobacterium sp. SO1]|uniref:hypothetical protein n=1 Tax=Bifidobacterium sp. SO1 TaxID=2809029 RepID=UPI001BDC07E9|nr:hypothetical protein [Bifidobacterium sp. SO1]MBT1161841.1 hypothetical protein [Bifidobacterium sp. SO1]
MRKRMIVFPARILIGIILSMMMLFLLRRLGLRPVWMTEHPDIGLAPMILLPFVPDSNAGLRLASITIGMACGLWLVGHARERPVYGPPVTSPKKHRPNHKNKEPEWKLRPSGQGKSGYENRSIGEGILEKPTAPRRTCPPRFSGALIIR